MGALNDLGTAIVAGLDEKTGYPVDEYGHLIDPYSPRDGELTKGWDENGTKLFNLTNPYGHLHFACGTGDDFFCFDYSVIRQDDKVAKGDFMILHSTINSETGSFIMGGGYKVIPVDQYDWDGLCMVSEAVVWCVENEVEHTKRGWNQDPWYFARCVHLAYLRIIGETPSFKITDRMKRFGGLKMDRLMEGK